MPHSVLCVDDDRSFCQIIAKALVGEGYSVRTAHDGEEALASFRAEPPDLVLLDVLLPKRDGFGVLADIRGLGNGAADTPALLISGCSRSPEYVERAQSLRAGALLTKPVPLDALLEHVRKALEGAPRVQPGAGAVRPEPRLSGSLAELPFPALLHHLHGLRASGALLLRSGKRRKGIQMRDGHPVAVRSNLVGECLGNLLVRMGRIDEAALKESLQRMERGEGLQGEIFVAMEVLSEDEVMNALRVQAEEKLFEIFEWSDGTFEFKRGGRLKGASALALERSPANLIVEGVRSRFPLARIDAYLEANAGAAVGGSESPFYQFQDVDLGASDREVLERLGTAPRLGELLGADEDTRRLVYGLLAAELVELRRSPPGAHGAARVHADAVAAARARLAAARSQAGDPRETATRTELAAMAERMRGCNFFEILGVPRDAGDEAVRSAYVDLAKRTHPDRFSGSSDAIKRLAEEVFGFVSRAFEALSHGRRREAYRLELIRGARIERELEEGRRALAAEHEFQQGETALRARRYREASEAFKRAVELYPQEGEYLAYLGWVRFLGAPDDPAACGEAIKALRQAAKLAPDSEKPYLLLGRLLKAIGHAAAAERMFVKAVQLKSDCVEALRELRLINLRRGRGRGRGLVRRLLRR